MEGILKLNHKRWLSSFFLSRLSITKSLDIYRYRLRAHPRLDSGMAHGARIMGVLSNATLQARIYINKHKNILKSHNSLLSPYYYHHREFSSWTYVKGRQKFFFSCFLKFLHYHRVFFPNSTCSNLYLWYLTSHVAFIRYRLISLYHITFSKYHITNHFKYHITNHFIISL